jgi:hypothetical protein
MHKEASGDKQKDSYAKGGWAGGGGGGPGGPGPRDGPPRPGAQLRSCRATQAPAGVPPNHGLAAVNRTMRNGSQGLHWSRKRVHSRGGVKTSLRHQKGGCPQHVRSAQPQAALAACGGRASARPSPPRPPLGQQPAGQGMTIAPSEMHS